jgi:hypothetical protein
MVYKWEVGRRYEVLRRRFRVLKEKVFNLARVNQS